MKRKHLYNFNENEEGVEQNVCSSGITLQPIAPSTAIKVTTSPVTNFKILKKPIHHLNQFQ